MSSAPGGTRAQWITLAAMTASASMILVDQTAVPLATPHAVEDLGGRIDEAQWILTANILPLAAFMVLGGRLGDLYGLRRVFLIGAVGFGVSTAFAGFAQDMAWMIAARAAQGTGAALMMPTGVAIVSSVFPDERRGTALGILAGGSAFFAALGPVMGGLLTAIDWRLVFLINVPLAAAAIAMTLRATPPLRPGEDARQRIDYPGVFTFALGIGALTFGLSQGQAGGWGNPVTVIPLAAGVVGLAAFVLVELRVAKPMIEFRLFRHVNFLAANLSQMLAGVVELGLGFLLPFYLLLVVGVSPAIAGIALLPGTIPIILAGPLAGRVFDRYGGRIPLVAGYLFLAASGVALALGASHETAAALIPGLVLQGIGLGVVLTTNDPTGLTAVPDDKQGEAAGIINTAEQLGGAFGIAGLTAAELTYYYDRLYDKFGEQGVRPTEEQVDIFRDFILHAEQVGLRKALEEAGDSVVIRVAYEDAVTAHVAAFELVFLVSAAIALVGALVMLVLVRKSDRTFDGPIFSRRSRWVYTTASVTPGITKRPDPGRPAEGSGPPDQAV
jgi:EmrB/QacA subfamily drug resistance transporter